MRAVRRTAFLGAALLLAAACAGTTPPASTPGAPATGSPGATDSPVATSTAGPSMPVVPSAVPGMLPAASGQAGLDWAGLAPRAWVDLEPWNIAAGGAGLLVTGARRETEPLEPVAFALAGGAWTDVTPPADGAPWSIFDLPVVLDDGFVVLGTLGSVRPPDRAVAWRADAGDPRRWAITDAVPGWGPHAAAPIDGAWLVLANTMTGLGGPPESTWTTTDFARWQEVPLDPAFPYARILRTLRDGPLIVAGFVADEAIDVVPRPVGEVTFWRTVDGDTWDASPAGAAFADASIWDVAVGDAGITAFGRRWSPDIGDGRPAPSAFWWSEDGVAWAQADGPEALPSFDGSILLALDDRYVLLGTAQGVTYVVASSPDGRAWTALDVPISLGGEVREAVIVGDVVLAVGSTDVGGAIWATPLSDR